MKRRIALALSVLPFGAFAQGESLMYSEGKIYVVIAVIALIFLGLAGYLVKLDRSISKLENEK